MYGGRRVRVREQALPVVIEIFDHGAGKLHQ
jgi:hypothetical protein